MLLAASEPVPSPNMAMGAGFVLLAQINLFLLTPPLLQNAIEHLNRLETSQFIFTPPERYVNLCERVTMVLVSTDVVHGLSINGYDIGFTAESDETTAGSFDANKPGYIQFALDCLWQPSNVQSRQNFAHRR